jgi:hypothetical protein
VAHHLFIESQAFVLTPSRFMMMRMRLYWEDWRKKNRVKIILLVHVLRMMDCRLWRCQQIWKSRLLEEHREIARWSRIEFRCSVPFNAFLNNNFLVRIHGDSRSVGSFGPVRHQAEKKKGVFELLDRKIMFFR